MGYEIRYRVAQLSVGAISKDFFLKCIRQIIAEYCNTESEAKKAIKIMKYWIDVIIKKMSDEDAMKDSGLV